MALSNAEKQARWRERHAYKRRKAQRLANLLMGKNHSDDRVAEMAAVLNSLLSGESLRILRWELRSDRQDPPRKPLASPASRKVTAGSKPLSIEALIG
jgi:hypothetical protein